MEGMTEELLTAIEAETDLSRGIVVGAHAYLLAELGRQPAPAEVIGYLVQARIDIAREEQVDLEHAVDPPGDAS